MKLQGAGVCPARSFRSATDSQWAVRQREDCLSTGHAPAPFTPFYPFAHIPQWESTQKATSGDVSGL